MFEAKILLSGEIHTRLFNEFGGLVDEREFPNVVTTAGKKHVADQLSGTPDEAVMSHMALGSGSTGAVVGDTTLETEAARVALTSITQLSGSDAVKVQYLASFGAGVGTASITEAGIFNDSSTGSLLCRQTFATITKGANDVLEVTWTLTVG